MTTKLSRFVATYSRARNAPKYISDEPRSRMNTSMNIAAPQTTSNGPRCLSGGIVTPRMRREPCTSTWRLSCR